MLVALMILYHVLWFVSGAECQECFGPNVRGGLKLGPNFLYC